MKKSKSKPKSKKAAPKKRKAAPSKKLRINPPVSVRFLPHEEQELQRRAAKLKGPGRKSIGRVIRLALGFDKDAKAKKEK